MGIRLLISCLSLLIGGVPAMAAPSDLPLVAVIDSGIGRTSELAPLLVGEYDMASSRARPAFHPRYDHGTMVATILARSLMRQVRIVSLRIDDPAGCPEQISPPCQQDPVRVARAIRQAARLRVDAINISLTLSDDPRIVNAIRDAAQAGITVTLAAGNDGLDHPSNLTLAREAFPYAVLVGALDATGTPWAGTNRPEAGMTGYHYAWQLGVDVPTAMADGAPAVATGTSFATPIETARLVRQRQDRGS
ncbi:S8 family peptidase [Sphingosinicella terrae]|uniref:S8 family peptidase n=1 Tax=Sphingosinicella terrae TaxID=2172047 RepID=UPI000E0CC097|nr:S8/S53 family peptidase [Sphingosinicella terrae]